MLMQRGKKAIMISDLAFQVVDFPGDGAASMAMKGLKTTLELSECLPGAHSL